MKDLLFATFFFVYASIMFFISDLTYLEFQACFFLVSFIGLLLTLVIVDTYFFSPIYKLLEEKPEEPEDYQI